MAVTKNHAYPINTGSPDSPRARYITELSTRQAFSNTLKAAGYATRWETLAVQQGGKDAQPQQVSEGLI